MSARISVILAAALGSLLAGKAALAEHTFEIVRSFELPDAFASDLTFGPDGALYGTTREGGAANRGTIFRVETNGTFERLHSFEGNDGWNIGSSLVLGGDGAFYGVSGSGGSFNRGSIFRIDLLGNFSVVHSFSGPDGAYPTNLIAGRDGSIYGITNGGGSFDRGTVFLLDRAGSFRSLYSLDLSLGFFGASNVPVVATDGALYGVSNGGWLEYPTRVFHPTTIFRIESDGTYTALRTFGEGVEITNSLAVGSDGALYGAIWHRGVDVGSIFRIDDLGAFTILHTFDYDAWFVGVRLSVGSDGSLYGSTWLRDREPHSGGTLFRIDPDGNFTWLLSSGGAMGRPLVLGSDGSLYGIGFGGFFRVDREGTVKFLPGIEYQYYWYARSLVLGDDGAFYSATDGQGVVFRLDTVGTVSVIHTFGSPDGFSPQPILAVGDDGAIYGATNAGGALHNGALFKVDRAGAFTRLHDFGMDELGGGYPPYYFPPRSRLRALTAGGDGAVYGITPYGGETGAGQLFRVDSAGTFTVLAPLTGGRSYPVPASLVRAGDGVLYGSGHSVFEIDDAVVTPLVESFDVERCGSMGPYGQYPWDTWSGPLALGRDGSLYGINSLFCSYGEGGSYQYDSLFRVDSAGNLTFLHQFAGSSWSPPTGLTAGSDGALYGTRSGSESSVFRVDPSGGVSTVHTFAPDVGASLFAPLLLGSDGALYGTTFGTIFRLDDAARFETVHSFSGADGSYVTAPMVLANNGSIYGTTWLGGGASNAGTVFEIDSAGAFRSVYTYAQSPLAYDQSHFVVTGEDCALYGVAGGGPAGGGILYRLFEPGHLCQQIHFDPIADRVLGRARFTIDATASSGLPVSFSAEGRCSIRGQQVLVTGPGTCSVTAYQDGDSQFEPAPRVTHTFTVRPPGRLAH